MYLIDGKGNSIYVNMPYSGDFVSYSIDPKIQKSDTYRILHTKYEEQLAKYKNASEAYKKTAEYARLKSIVSRLRATLAQMDKDMGR